VDPNDYDDWYQTPRGRWIGETEYQLLHKLLAPAPGERLLDVGCGTGYFTRRFARSGNTVTGIDSDPAMLAFAKAHAVSGEHYLAGDARALPFPDRSFDLGLSVTALCFIPRTAPSARRNPARHPPALRHRPAQPSQPAVPAKGPRRRARRLSRRALAYGGGGSNVICGTTGNEPENTNRGVTAHGRKARQTE
jgi:SAM-dependent methyltransferase